MSAAVAASSISLSAAPIRPYWMLYLVRITEKRFILQGLSPPNLRIGRNQGRVGGGEEEKVLPCYQF